MGKFDYCGGSIGKGVQSTLKVHLYRKVRVTVIVILRVQCSAVVFSVVKYSVLQCSVIQRSTGKKNVLILLFTQVERFTISCMRDVFHNET